MSVDVARRPWSLKKSTQIITGVLHAALQLLFNVWNYTNVLKLEDVYVLMNYSWTQTHEIHGKALEQLREQEKPEA